MCSSTVVLLWFCSPLLLRANFFCRLSPFLFSFPSSGWETCHSCRGTASLSRVALSRLHQNIPPRVTPVTDYPFYHPTVVGRKLQHSSSTVRFLHWLQERSLWLLISLLWVWFMISALIWAGWCLYLTSGRADWTLSYLSTWRYLPKCYSLKQALVNVMREKWILVGNSINIWLSFLESSL